MTAKEKPLPCPFCGEQPEMLQSRKTRYRWCVRCRATTCACYAYTGTYPTQEEAVAAWNRRKAK